MNITNFDFSTLRADGARLRVHSLSEIESKRFYPRHSTISQCRAISSQMPKWRIKRQREPTHMSLSGIDGLNRLRVLI